MPAIFHSSTVASFVDVFGKVKLGLKKNNFDFVYYLFINVKSKTFIYKVKEKSSKIALFPFFSVSLT